MFTEFELATMAEQSVIKAATQVLKQEFKEKEMQFLDLSDHDFLALAMMTPSIGIALSNGSVSFFEERALNKKARKLSKGGYFLEKDPVVHAMQFLIKNFKDWRSAFFGLLHTCMQETFDLQAVTADEGASRSMSDTEFRLAIMRSPYALIRFIGTFFMEDDQDIFSARSVLEVEHKAIHDIGEELGLTNIPIFNKICETTFHIR